MGTIPKEAKRVFKGILYDVYHWEQNMFDGSTQTYEMLKRTDNVSVLVTQGDQILISEEEQPHWPPFLSLFGGRLEENEDILVGAQRELLEETGMKSEDWELLRVYNPRHTVDMKLNVFIAREAKIISEPRLDPGEKIRVRSVSFEAFLRVVARPDFLHQSLALDIMRMQLYDSQALEEFRKNLFLSKI